MPASRKADTNPFLTVSLIPNTIVSRFVDCVRIPMMPKSVGHDPVRAVQRFRIA